MLTLRSALVGLAVVVLGVALGGCAQSCKTCTLPKDLPDDPEPCTKYCKVWVEPVYRDRPVVVQKRAGCTKEVPETVCEAQFSETCVRPRCQYEVETCGKRCDTAVIQTKPGGYKWKRDGDCWRYCYEEPCYQWCNKVVEEDGIRYCMEVPPEYTTDVSWEPVTRYRTVYTPAEFETKWVKELYRPGHYEWQPSKECERCDCPAPCPTVPYTKSPCRPGTDVMTAGCPRCN